MFGIVLSVFNVALGFILRKVVVTVLLSGALLWVVAEFTSVLVSSVLPAGGDLTSSLNSTLGAIPASVWYFLDMFAIPYGISVLLSAYVARFIVRRIPGIG